ncbi:MAG: hypothetical protein KF782_31525 [Labilithrix sp.]|nr:hypothetical protein [Labilithrix sp.]
MGRQDTIVFGSGAAPTNAPGARSETPITPRAPATEGLTTAARRLPPLSPPPRPDRARHVRPSEHEPSATAPGAEPLDAAWFAATSPMLRPIGHELEERRGWTPPRAGKGLGFAVASVAAIAVASAGTFFFVGPSTDATRPADPEPTSTPTLTHAELPPAEGTIAEGPSTAAVTTTSTAAATTTSTAAATTTSTAAATTSPTAATTTAGAERVITPADLPSAPAVTARRAAPAPRAKELAEAPLPDLDRAAAAAGATPAGDTPSETTASETATPPEPFPETSPREPREQDEAPPTAPPPSEVLPDLQIKR